MFSEAIKVYYLNIWKKIIKNKKSFVYEQIGSGEHKLYLRFFVFLSYFDDFELVYNQKFKEFSKCFLKRLKFII